MAWRKTGKITCLVIQMDRSTGNVLKYRQSIKIEIP